MIRFDLLKKEDIAVLLEGFETSFLQVPMKHVPKEVLKFVPNGFRVEKLGRLQLLKVYTEALLSGEITITSYIEREIQQNFESYGLDSYMAERIDKEYPVSTYIVEISNIIFESGLIIPAHIVLMLYGIECSQKEKEISDKLHRVFHEQKKQAKQDGFDAGYSKGEEKFSVELETEQKKNARLQKSIDNLNTKNKVDTKKSKYSDEEYEILARENDENKSKIKDLQKTYQEQEDDLYALYEERTKLKKTNENLSQELNRVLSELQRIKTETAETIEEKCNELLAIEEKCSKLAASEAKYRELLANEQKQKEPIPAEEIKAVCVDAIKLFSSQNAGKSIILANAKEMLTDSQDVKSSWEKLNAATFSIIDEINTALCNNSFDLQMLDKFAEIETMLLLESAIQRALRELAYRAIASSTVKEEAEEDLFDQE